MKLCKDVITVFNKRWDDENGWDTYYPTVITNVSWYSTVASNVGDKGLNAANKIIVRIPVDADFGGKAYADPAEYAKAESVTSLFTLANGDYIVKAAVTGTIQKPAELKEAFPGLFCTVLGVTDNRRAPNAPHWRVVGS